MHWSAQSNWSTFVWRCVTLGVWKQENTGGQNDDMPRWEEMEETSEWAWFSLAFIGTEENNGNEMVPGNMFEVLWSNIDSVVYKLKAQ